MNSLAKSKVLSTDYKNRGKVLFIVHDVYQNDNVFPMGIGYLAAVLKNKGYQVQIYHMDVYHYSNDDLAKFLDENEFDLIGIGFLAARFKETVFDLIHVIANHKKNALTILGGHGPSPIPEYMLETTPADIVAIGEAEQTIVDLIECKLARGDLGQVKGIAYKKEGTTIVNPRQSIWKNINLLPLPAWDLFPMDIYTANMVFPRMQKFDKSFSILCSRGCVGKCNFCYQLEKGFRIRSPENFVKEMKILHDTYGINYFCFLDDLSLTSKKKFKQLVDEIKENDLKVQLNIEARVDIIDEELVDMMEEAGVSFVNIGFESMSQKVLNIMKKKTTVEDNFKAAEIVTKSGLNLGINLIWAEPGDDEESLNNAVDFIMKYSCYEQIRTIRPVTPYPGSPLYYEAIDKGLLKGPADFFEKFNNSDRITVNFTEMSDERCYELLLKANSRLIRNYFQNTNQDMQEAAILIDQYRDLYSGKILNFRGSRSYKRE